MSLIFATVVAVITASVLVVFGVMFTMILQRNKALADQIRVAQGSLGNILKGQMKAPDSLPRHWVGGGMAWNERTHKHERQSAVALGALKGVFLAK